ARTCRPDRIRVPRRRRSWRGWPLARTASMTSTSSAMAGWPHVFGGVYAPSTLGSFLRCFTWGHVLQLQAAARDLLAALTRRTPLLPGAAALTYVDVDSLLRRVYGHAKQGAGFGHAKVGGYNVRLRG